MSTAMTAREILDREFLEVRARLIQLAAALDRLDRAEGSVANDTRLSGVRQALDVLGSGESDRAEQIQLIFSRSYEPGWRGKMGVGPRPQSTNGASGD